jgi:hypothetical protein
LPGTVARWNRETSAPTVKVEALSDGFDAISSSILRSAAGSVPSGTVTSPEAIARSSSAVLSAIERSDRESWPIVCATAIFSEIFGVRLERDRSRCLDLGLAFGVLGAGALVGGKHADVADDGLGDLERLAFAAAGPFLGEDDVHPVAREDEAGDAAGRRDADRHGPHPGPSAAAR